MVLASHETSNLLNQPPAVSAFEYLSVLISIVLALGMTRVLAGVGEMLQVRIHRRSLLGARDLDLQSFYLSHCSVVDFLSLAQPAIVELLSFRFCPYLANDFVSRFNASFST